MRTGIVIPVGPGRRENVEDCLRSIAELTTKPERIMLVFDGHNEMPQMGFPGRVDIVRIKRGHQPGMEQPRNIGVNYLFAHDPKLTHAWFIDSDVLVAPHALDAYQEAVKVVGEHTILIGPYEFMPPGIRRLAPELHQDLRWPLFHRGLGPYVGERNVGLACFSGNLVWPIPEFRRIGGFHPELHHGRCEDGELGLRAASHEIPMALVSAARGYHIAHPVDLALVHARNARDIPLIDKWHPEQGLIVSDEDGARFDVVCSCGERMNTLLLWDHMSRCPNR